MTRKRNSQKVGAVPDDSAPLSVVGGDLNFVTPTEFVDLPSGGNYYPEGHPLHNQDTLEIKYMTAKEEDILNSDVLLQKGIAIDRMLQNILVDKSVSIEDLLIGDKNALIVSARISGYGSDYPVSINCPSCFAKNEVEVDLEESKSLSGAVKGNLKNLEEVLISENNYPLLTLPRSNVKVELRFLTSKDESDIEKAEQSAKKHKLPPSQLTNILKKMIYSVNGNADRAVINNFVSNMPAMDSKYIRGVYKIINPTLKLEHEFVCSSCTHDGTVEVPITPAFFWPDR